MCLCFETQIDDCPLCYTTKIVNIIVLAAAVIISVLVHSIVQYATFSTVVFCRVYIYTHTNIIVYILYILRILCDFLNGSSIHNKTHYVKNIWQYFL